MIQKHAACGKLVFGICGGYQMLGESVLDADEVESSRTKKVRGLGLLEGSTVFEPEKVQKQVQGKLGKLDGILSDLSGMEYTGYEIHMGRTDVRKEANGIVQGRRYPNVYGTYIHGIFDAKGIAKTLAQAIANNKGVELNQATIESYQEYKETQYELLAKILKDSLNMEQIYCFLGLKQL